MKGTLRFPFFITFWKGLAINKSLNINKPSSRKLGFKV